MMPRSAAIAIRAAAIARGLLAAYRLCLTPFRGNRLVADAVVRSTRAMGRISTERTAAEALQSLDFIQPFARLCDDNVNIHRLKREAASP